MALRDHSLDQGIIDAARGEFMEHGFQKASLHKIADRAGITTGALYTRYKNKDALFCSLVAPALQEMARQMTPMESLYEQARQQRDVELLLNAIQKEEAVYLELLFRQYDACVLLFCKSDGSSLQLQMEQMMQRKARQSVEFFRTIAVRQIDFDGIELIISQQFSFYRQILLRGYTREKAIQCLQTLDLFLEAGWKAVFNRIL